MLSKSTEMERLFARAAAAIRSTWAPASPSAENSSIPASRLDADVELSEDDLARIREILAEGSDANRDPAEMMP